MTSLKIINHSSLSLLEAAEVGIKAMKLELSKQDKDTLDVTMVIHRGGDTEITITNYEN